MSIVRKFVRNPEIVKDLTQEIFIRAYLNYDYYTETGKIKSWLAVIANNKLKNYYKAEHYRNERAEFLILEDFALVLSHEETPENVAEQNDFTEQIVKIINTLPQKQRDAVFYSVMYNWIHAKRMKKVFPYQHINTVFYTEKAGSMITRSSLAPNLYEAKTHNFMGNNAKSAIYLALPEKAENIRMKRGNGILDCGKYKFIYADRYVTADEGIFAECTFNM